VSNANVVPFLRPRPAAVATTGTTALKQRATGPPQQRTTLDDPIAVSQTVRLARTLREDTLSVRFLTQQNILELLVPRRTKRVNARLHQLLAATVATGEFFADGVAIPVADYSVGVESIDRAGQPFWRLIIATHASMRPGIQCAHRLIWQLGITQRTFLLQKGFRV